MIEDRIFKSAIEFRFRPQVLLKKLRFSDVLIPLCAPKLAPLWILLSELAGQNSKQQLKDGNAFFFVSFFHKLLRIKCKFNEISKSFTGKKSSHTITLFCTLFGPIKVFHPKSMHYLYCMIFDNFHSGRFVSNNVNKRELRFTIKGGFVISS